MKNDRLKRYIYNFSFDYETIKLSDMRNIKNYFMKKQNTAYVD